MDMSDCNGCIKGYPKEHTCDAAEIARLRAEVERLRNEESDATVEWRAEAERAERERDEAIKAAQKTNADEERAQEALDAERALADRLAALIERRRERVGCWYCGASQRCRPEGLVTEPCLENCEARAALAAHAAERLH